MGSQKTEARSEGRAKIGRVAGRRNAERVILGEIGTLGPGSVGDRRKSRVGPVDSSLAKKYFMSRISLQKDACTR
jgi:hypothetical protein